jgi:hypothetical protein
MVRLRALSFVGPITKEPSMPPPGKSLRKNEPIERPQKRGRKARDEDASGKAGNSPPSVVRPLMNALGFRALPVAGSRDAALALARARVAAKLAAEDRLNAFYGRKKGGVAR